MVRGIKLGRFATRYDGIFYKQNRIKYKKQKKEKQFEHIQSFLKRT